MGQTNPNFSQQTCTPLGFFYFCLMNFKLSLLIPLVGMFCFCTKKVAKNPELAYSDTALFDSTQNANYKYYQNDPNNLLPAAGNSPHGSFKLRFNSIAYAALTAGGKLPVGGTFPEGSFLVKDVYSGGSIGVYAYMYKHNGSWLWGEVKSSGDFLYYAKDGPSVCVGCHSQSGNRDMVTTFQFH